MRKETSEIEKVANSVRKRLAIESLSAPCMVYVLEKLKELMPGFNYEVQNKNALLHNVEADMDVDNKQLRISSQTWHDLIAGNARARFTIAHEIGHLFLNHKGKLRRDKEKRYSSSAKMMESEADKFASFFLVPTSLAGVCETTEELISEFRISASAAENIMPRVERQKRKNIGKPRKLPESALKWMHKMEKENGWVFRSIKNQKEN